MAITLAAKYEPLIEAVLHLVIPALQALRKSPSGAVLLGDVERILRTHGLTSDIVVGALNRIPGPTPEGNPDAFNAGSDNASI